MNILTDKLDETEALRDRLPIYVDYTVVTDDAALAAVCQRWAACEALALDTEFMRVTTFYPKVALIQVTDGTSITLIDPLTIQYWQPFSALLTSLHITKIFHSCSEDLLVFFSFLGILPTPVFDTQVATALLNEGVGLSYQNLVKQRFNVDLPKGETRSDWLQRPLTQEQMEYAALDVAFLYQTWESQRQALRSQGRESWLFEETARQQQQYATEFTCDFSEFYLNFKAAWQLQPRQLVALQKLTIWREQRARKRDRPRSWIIKDTALFALAQTMCTSRSQLAAIEDVSENFVRHEGDQVLALIGEVAAMADHDCSLTVPKPLTQGQKNRLKKAQELVEKKGAELAIPPEILGRKRTLLALLYASLAVAGTDVESALLVPEELRGWRGPLLLEPLLEIFRS